MSEDSIKTIGRCGWCGKDVRSNQHHITDNYFADRNLHGDCLSRIWRIASSVIDLKGILEESIIDPDTSSIVFTRASDKGEK